MDTQTPELPADPVKIVGYGLVAPEGLAPGNETGCDVAPLLKDRKSIKFMSKQDKLGLAAAVAAVKHAGLGETELKTRTGIYLAMGILPFEQDQIEELGNHSATNGKLDPQRYSTEAFQRMNPLLTFKCLPNMPVFHISYNLGIHGGYFITYPGVGQWFKALENACLDLRDGQIDYALVGAAADQRNMLVRHHVRRTDPGALDRLIDSACVLVLARGEDPRPALATIRDLELSYEPTDPFQPSPRLGAAGADGLRRDGGAGSRGISAACGPVAAPLSVVLALQAGVTGEFRGEFSAPDGVGATFRLEIR